MPLHDWSRVDAGIFHDFHVNWVGRALRFLNSGGLAPEWYALSARQEQEDFEEPTCDRTEEELYAARRRIITIYTTDSHQALARIEMVSPAEKEDKRIVDRLVSRMAADLQQGINLLLIDLHPATGSGPNSVHDALLKVICRETRFDESRPPMAAFYAVDTVPPTVFHRQWTFGEELCDLLLPLPFASNVSLPLEQIYMEAFEGTARFYCNILEA